MPLLRNNLLSSERGAVTAEFAICIPVVVFFLGLLLSVTYLSGKQNLAQQVVSNTLREAIVLPESAEKQARLREIADLSLPSNERPENLQLDIDFSEGWVRVEAKIALEGNPIASIVKEVSASASGKIEL